MIGNIEVETVYSIADPPDSGVARNQASLATP